MAIIDLESPVHKWLSRRIKRFIHRNFLCKYFGHPVAEIVYVISLDKWYCYDCLQEMPENKTAELYLKRDYYSDESYYAFTKIKW